MILMRNKPQTNSALGLLRGGIGSALKQLTLVLAASLLLAGCTRYDVRLSDGMQFINVHKPVFDKATGQCTIKNAGGRVFVVKSSKVMVVEPHQSEKQRAKDGSFYLN